MYFPLFVKFLIERFRGVGPCELFLFLWLIRHVYSLSKTAAGDAFFQSSRHRSRDSTASDFSLISTIVGPHESDLGIGLLAAAPQSSLSAARTQSSVILANFPFQTLTTS